MEMVIFMNFQKNFMLDLMQTLLWYEPQLSSNPLGFLNHELYNVAGSSYDDWWFHSPDSDHLSAAGLPKSQESSRLDVHFIAVLRRNDGLGLCLDPYQDS